MSGFDHLHEARREAIRREDIDEALELLTPDYVLWPAGAPPIEMRRRRVFLVLRRGDDGRWRYARGVSRAGSDPA